MPFIPDYSDDDEDQGRSGSSGSSGGGGAVMANPSPQKEEQFTPWSRFVSANQDVSQREADKLTTQVQGQVDRATKARTGASAQHQKDIESNYVPAGIATIKPPANAASQQTNQAPAGSSFGAAASYFGQQQQEQPPASPPPQPANLNEKTIDPNRLKTDVVNGKPITKGDGIKGAKDLETQLGTPAWESLIRDTLTAEQQAGALATTSGVEAMLQKTAQPVNSAFDAGLIGGAGGKVFQDLARNYGGSKLGDALLQANTEAQDRWRTLMGDVDSASAARDQEIIDYNEALRRRLEQGQEAPKAQKQPINVSPYATSPYGVMTWMERAAKGTGAGSAADRAAFIEWAKQIYGDGFTDQQLWDKLYADLQKMSWEEFDAFRNGTVPDWMGLGENATGFNGLGDTAIKTSPVSDIDFLLFGSKGWGEHEDSFDKIRAELHRAGLSASPADWAAWGLGEAGIDTPLPTEEFAAAFIGNFGRDNWQKAKVRMALFQVLYEYGQQAAGRLVQAMKDNPAILAQYLGMKNPGFMARNMRAWLESAGFKKQKSTTEAQWNNIWGGRPPADTY